MTKFKGSFGIDSAEAVTAEVEGGNESGYTGAIPPTGTYKGKLKILQLVKTGERSLKPGSPMLKIMVELEDKGEKAKYNGYGAWSNQTIREDSVAYVNAFLDSLTGGNKDKAMAVRKWFWDGNLNTEEADGGNIIAIGKLKVMSPDGNIPVIIRGKYVPEGEYPAKLDTKRFLVPAASATKVEDEFDDSGDSDPDLDDGLDDAGDFDESDGEPGF